jgi:hypothetical protein
MSYQAGWWARRHQQESQDEQLNQGEPRRPAPLSMHARLAQLKQLGKLKTQGVLSDAEFEQRQSRILNSDRRSASVPRPGTSR